MNEVPGQEEARNDLYGGALSAAGGPILLDLLVDLITDTSGFCFCAEAGCARSDGLVFLGAIAAVSGSLSEERNMWVGCGEEGGWPWPGSGFVHLRDSVDYPRLFRPTISIRPNSIITGPFENIKFHITSWRLGLISIPTKLLGVERTINAFRSHYLCVLSQSPLEVSLRDCFPFIRITFPSLCSGIQSCSVSMVSVCHYPPSIPPS